MLFFCYHTLWRLVLFVANLFRNFLPPKIQCYLAEREISFLAWRRKPEPWQRRIWFHAASGEFEYLRSLLRLWKQNNPEDLLFVTYFSTSARPLLETIKEIDGWAPLPEDLPEPCHRFLKELRPHLLLIARTDLWPTVLSLLKDRPKLLLASTWAEGSKKTQGIGQWMSRWCLRYINKVCVVSNEDARWLGKISPTTPVTITGDPRFDQVQFRLKQRRDLPLALQEWSKNHFVFIAGSTWTEDEVIIIDAWKKAKLSKARLLLVPHENHPEHLQRLCSLLKEQDLSASLWSQANDEEMLRTEVLIFDQRGWLAELYQLANLAFIGGSFKKQVHSVMEALGCGLPVIVGPHYKNNREAIEFAKLHDQGQFFVEIVNDSESLTQTIKKHWQQDPISAKKLSTEIRSAFEARCGATQRTYEEIQTWL